MNTGPYAPSLSRTKVLGADSHGKASVICRVSHSAGGCLVTSNQSNRRGPWPKTKNANNPSQTTLLMSASGPRTSQSQRSPLRGCEGMPSSLGKAASCLAPGIWTPSIAPHRTQASTTRRGSEVRPTMGSRGPSVGSGRAELNRSLNALPFSAISTAKTLESPPDADAGLSLAPRPELTQATEEKVGSSRPAKPDRFATVGVWAPPALMRYSADDTKRYFRHEAGVAT